MRQISLYNQPTYNFPFLWVVSYTESTSLSISYNHAPLPRNMFECQGAIFIFDSFSSRSGLFMQERGFMSGSPEFPGLPAYGPTSIYSHSRRFNWIPRLTRDAVALSGQG